MSTLIGRSSAHFLFQVPCPICSFKSSLSSTAKLCFDEQLITSFFMLSWDVPFCIRKPGYGMYRPYSPPTPPRPKIFAVRQSISPRWVGYIDHTIFGAMIESTRSVPLVSLSDQQVLLSNVNRNPRHKLMVLLLLDCGLRVTEMCSLKLGNFDFRNQTLSVKSLKKKSETPIYRTIPLTPRVTEALSEVYIKLKDKSSSTFLFHTKSERGYISRIRVWRMIKKNSSYTVSPHSLRHTFASTIVSKGADIRTAQDLLGHASYKTTEIYLHVAKQERINAIRSIDRRTPLKRWKDKLFPRKNVFIIDDSSRFNDVYVGRKNELKQINELFHKKVNTILIGPQGIGKSKILSMLSHEKILFMNDFKGVKTAIGEILLKLYDGDKEKVIQLITQEADIHKVVTKKSIPNLINLIIKTTEKNEYTLIIDDLSNLTASGVTALEQLKNHFHIMAAARQIKYSHASFLSNFQKVEVTPLSRLESTQLIIKLSKPMRDRIEDLEAYKNHICDQTDGNPLFIREMIERYGKEPLITLEHLSSIRHTAALREIDLSAPVIIGFSSLMVLRYIGGELGDDAGAFKLFGGSFMLFALFARGIFSAGKRKFV